MSRTIPVEELARTVAEELESYRQEVTDGVKDSVRQVSRECLAEIRAGSPRKSGRYRRGWRAEVSYESAEDLRITVRNRTSYQLTHLLEHGHVNVLTGGRTEGIPHIRPAEQHAAEKLERRVKVVVKGGG